MAAPTSKAETNGTAIDVARADGRFVVEPLVANDPSQAIANVRRLHAILAKAGESARVYFPAGDYYLHGAARPNRGSVESTAPGQVFYGDGPQVSRLIQTDLRRDFGFEANPERKHVPAATLRIAHKGCAVRQLGFVIDPAAAERLVIPTVAVQIANIRYDPDGNIGIVETTGIGANFIVDHVLVQDIQIGERLGSGLQATRFFAVGIDIVGSGGHVRVFDVHRTDARIGVRLDNGNHCGQGEYWFRNIHLVGRHGVTDGGCFFDWVGGQAPMIFHCSAAFSNGLHAGALGLDGDRFEPFAEGAVVRRNGRKWDWLTWHDHEVVDNPNPAQRTEWYGLPRQARVVRIGSEPRTGGTEWTEGRDYRIERIETPGDFEGATKIHWLQSGPKPGSVYYVEFEQPMQYRPHDLEWGILDGCSFQEAFQTDPEGFVVRFNDQGYGTRNPDFHFPVGYGFAIRHNFTLTGDLIFRGDVGGIKISDNVFGTGTVFIEGEEEEDGHLARRFTFEDNMMTRVALGDRIADITFTNNELTAPITVRAPTLARSLRFVGNRFLNHWTDGPETTPGALSLLGAGIGSLQINDNVFQNPLGDGVVVQGARDGTVSGNVFDGIGGTAILLRNTSDLVVANNAIAGCERGIALLDDSDETPPRAHVITGNRIRGFATDGLLLPAPRPGEESPVVVFGNSIDENP